MLFGIFGIPNDLFYKALDHLINSGPYAIMLAVLLYGIHHAVFKWLAPHLESLIKAIIDLIRTLKENDMKQTQILEEHKRFLLEHGTLLTQHGKGLVELMAQMQLLLNEMTEHRKVVEKHIASQKN